MRCTFVVLGPPVGKERPRRAPARPGQKARFYTPEKTRKYEQAVGWAALSKRPRGWALGAKYRVTLQAYFDTPRGDLDNVLKSVLDGCNKVLWDDDVQVVEVYLYRLEAGPPRVVVTAEVVTDVTAGPV